MNVQRKKGVLDVCVLAVLKRGPSYGYRIVNDISECIAVSESTLYPILRRLEASGCVSTYQQAYNGRTRKYYRIEEPGLQKVRDFLNEADEMKKIYTFVEGAEHE
ncbi:MAG: PadR family transcriptional regulator [Oscillospiraceae bacterium]|nr:PadR family transcriptional regulator [Oscillospiraceae bacterium]MDD3260532.1 PadR family transcriptional regulator [Oscillospiraceae bacterium]